MGLHNDEVISLISKHAKVEGVNETMIPGVSLFKASGIHTPTPCIYKPCLCIILQGSKKVILEKEIHLYQPLEYLSISVDLPMMIQIIKASKDKPYLLLKIDINLQQLSELMIDAKLRVKLHPKPRRGIFIGKVDPIMYDSIQRLVQLLDVPEQIPVLAAQTLREIFYRVLSSDYGDIVAMIALNGSNMQGIIKVIEKIRFSFNESITIEELSKIASMSISSFYANFKSVTAMSPLQFQKKLRLIEARKLMMYSNMGTATTAYKVGYLSPSQFNREYARMFGNPPGKDLSIWRQHQNQYQENE
jgi:AraC-like DNA-binding protein